MRPDTLAVVAVLAALPLLGACVATSPTGVATGARPPHRPATAPALIPPTRAPERIGLRPATVHMAPGLEGVIGATPSELTRQFGAPRLDVYEGDARKLQFTGGACVLDVFLYPHARGGEPQATYVEARQPTGADTDRAGCVAALRTRR
jgi:hypothetical protein